MLRKWMLDFIMIMIPTPKRACSDFVGDSSSCPGVYRLRRRMQPSESMGTVFHFSNSAQKYL